MLREEAGNNPDIIPCRYVLAIKHGQNNEPPKLKARFVLGGHKYKGRNKIVHDTCTVRPESVWLLIALSTILGLDIATADWHQGYVQSKSTLMRKVFIKPNEMVLGPNELVQVILPIYGLADAREYWAETLNNHLRDHCRFQQTITDLSLRFRSIGSKLVALAASYVDDVLLAATPQALTEFDTISRKRFGVSINTSNNLSYLGLKVQTLDDGQGA